MSDTTTLSPAEVVLDLIRRVGAADFAGAYDLCHEDIVLSLPTFLPKPVVTEGRAEQTALNNENSGPPVGQKAPRLYDDLRSRNVRVHRSTDPNVVIVEWDFISHVDGHEIVHPNIQVTRCRAGKMVHTTDYHTFVARAVANGEIPAFLDMIENMIIPEDRGGSAPPRPGARRPDVSTRLDTAAMKPAEVALEVLKRESTGDVAGVLELYADDIELTFPFVLPEPVVIKGKAALIALLEESEAPGGARPPRMYDDLHVRDVRVHETTDPEVAVVEWTYVSRIGDSTVVMPNIVVAQCRDGKIVRSTDYHDHVTRAVANGTVPACLEIIKNMTLPRDRT